MRIVLCDDDATIIDATPDNNHRDLFYGTFGSYASLGILVSVHLKLIKASSCVRVRYQRISLREAADATVLCAPEDGCNVDFCEGIIFSKTM